MKISKFYRNLARKFIGAGCYYPNCMARERTVPDDEESVDTDAERVESRGKDGLIDRRSYLTMAGIASVAGAGTIAGVGSVTAEEYEVIEANGQLIWVEDGETFENKIIDFSSGSYARIVTRGSGWTIRNIGFRGTHRTDYHAIVASCDGGRGVIENVYLGDGCIRPDQYSSHGQCGIFVHRSHDGHIDIRNCNIQEWPNNGIYASAPEYEGGGTIHIDNCYAANNSVSSYRLATNGSRVTNSVAYNDGGRYRGRCFWGWPPGELEIENCHFQSGPYPGAIHVGRDSGHTELTIRNSQYDSIRERGNVTINDAGGNGSSPDLSMPSGIPTSPEQAASGEGGSGGSSRPEGDHEELQHIYEFHPGDDDYVDYFFEVEEGPIEPSTFNGAEIEDGFHWISEDGTKAAGRVTDERHAWEFDTNLLDATVEGDLADVLINETDSNLDRYPLEGATGDEWKSGMPWQGDYPDLQHRYEFHPGDEEYVDYYFEVEEGPIEPSTLNDAELEPDYQWVSEDGTKAAGRLTDERHAWEFDTNLVDVTVEGDLEDVLVNGVDSNLDRYPLEGASGDDWKGDMPWHESDGLENVILFDGVGTDSVTRYEFIVSGEVEKSTDGGASIDDEDTIEDGHVSGAVASWRDAFRFSGEIEELSIDGSARVLVNGEEVDPSEYGHELPNLLTIVGSGNTASFEFTVDGDLEKVGDGEGVVSGSTAEGSLSRGVERYRFSGALTDFTFVDGTAHVYLNEDRIDPEEYTEGELLPHALVVDPTESDGESSYSFTVDGNVMKADYRDAKADDGDLIEETDVTGTVEETLDAYWFDGDITDFRLRGDAKVHVEYNVRDQ